MRTTKDIFGVIADSFSKMVTKETNAPSGTTVDRGVSAGGGSVDMTSVFESINKIADSIGAISKSIERTKAQIISGGTITAANDKVSIDIEPTEVLINGLLVKTSAKNVRVFGSFVPTARPMTLYVIVTH